MSRQKAAAHDAPSPFFDDLMAGFTELGEWAHGERTLRVTTLELDETAAVSATRAYAALFEEGRHGWAARVPDLPGCFAVGATLSETETALQAVIEEYVAARRDAGLPLASPVT